jgi:asparagine synthase (glutamine-hydrolysing)
VCGIVTIISRRETVNQEQLKSGIDALYHRGPDENNFLICGNSRVGLGHARLSINDLGFGKQPISNETGDIHIVVNGEFYGFRELREELKSRGHKFKTSSDSEILLHLYEEKGIHCLKDLRGEFAFVLVDDKNDLVFVGRDRFGVKPMYYAENGDKILVGSEVKAILSMGHRPRWDQHAVTSYMRLFVPNPDETFFADVKAVRPGHYLMISNGRVRQIQYWDMDMPLAGEDLKLGSDQDYIARFQELLSEAVKIRLEADVAIGYYLSGGIDSCAVLGLAHKFAGKGLQAFTLSFRDDSSYDEYDFAAKAAAMSGTSLHRIEVTPKDLADNFSDTIFHSETFCQNAHSVGKFLLSRFVRKNKYKVVLTGEGSDEVLGGYGFIRHDMLTYGDGSPGWRRDDEALKRMTSGNLASQGFLLAQGEGVSIDYANGLLGFESHFLKTRSTMAHKFSELLDDPFLSAAQKKDYLKVLFSSLQVNQKMAGRVPAKQSMYLLQKTLLPNNILTFLGDKVEMANSIEGRVPFLDHKVAEFCAQLPLSMMIRGGLEKYVLREAVKDVIPPEIYGREKHPFTAPPAAKHQKGPLFELMQDTFRGTGAKDVPFLSQKKILQLMDRLPKMTAAEMTAYDSPLMAALCACTMQSRFKMGW